MIGFAPVSSRSSLFHKPVTPEAVPVSNGARLELREVAFSPYPPQAVCLPRVGVLRHEYVLTRHGPTQANIDGVLRGRRQNAEQYPLLPEGRVLMQRSFQRAVHEGSLDSSWIIVSSPLLRARETAVIAAEVVGKSPDEIVVLDALAERDPGLLEGLRYRRRSSQSVLVSIPSHPTDLLPHGTRETPELQLRYRLLALAMRLNLAAPVIGALRVESAQSVLERHLEAIGHLEARFERPSRILLIGHEFGLGILMTALTPFPPGWFWVNRHIPQGILLPLTYQTVWNRFGVPTALRTRGGAMSQSDSMSVDSLSSSEDPLRGGLHPRISAPAVR